MSRIAFIFPGQGAQVCGMGQDFYEQTETGKRIFYEKMLTGLQGMIEVEDAQPAAYPRRLSLEQQGMFILGYYHQVQKRFEKKEEK